MLVDRLLFCQKLGIIYSTKLLKCCGVNTMKKQIALCIGNDNYQFDCLNKLKCAVNDSQAIAEKLSMLNFEVYSLSNVNREQLFSAVSDFAKKLSNYDVALFYFAGHGFECNGDNYLMPIDTGSLEKGAIEWMATPLTYVIDALNGNIATNNVKTKIIILVNIMNIRNY